MVECLPAPQAAGFRMEPLNPGDSDAVPAVKRDAGVPAGVAGVRRRGSVLLSLNRSGIETGATVDPVCPGRNEMCRDVVIECRGRLSGSPNHGIERYA